jgi:hypothetical protein
MRRKRRSIIREFQCLIWRSPKHQSFAKKVANLRAWPHWLILRHLRRVLLLWSNSTLLSLNRRRIFHLWCLVLANIRVLLWSPRWPWRLISLGRLLG